MVKGSQFRCTQDPNTKELICHSFRENKDGTKVELASLKARVDGQCNPVITDVSENVDGEFERLEKKVINRLVGTCEKLPDDY